MRTADIVGIIQAHIYTGSGEVCGPESEQSDCAVHICPREVFTNGMGLLSGHFSILARNFPL